MELLGFSIVLSAWIVCDTCIFLNGYSSFFFTAKTEEEKALHAAVIKRNTSDPDDALRRELAKANSLLLAYQARRAVDGTNGRIWDASEYAKTEAQIVALER